MSTSYNFSQNYFNTGEQYGNRLYYATSNLSTYLYPRLYGGLTMNEYINLTNQQLQEMFHKSRIAVNSITESMPVNDKQYLLKRHKELSSEILRRGTAFLLSTVNFCPFLI